jgi:hypothetical protein
MAQNQEPLQAAIQLETSLGGSRAAAVRVRMPASVAFNLQTLQKSIANLAERLGCKPCISGFDCTFLLERDYLINERAEVLPR